MSDYKITIGLEVHAELKTKSKMFCGCANTEGSTNSHICPICMGHPGTLPVINREAVKKVLTVGVAVGGVLADFTEFDRKNYFYPDIPKGYQISQYKYPLVVGGELNGVKLTRIHLEEDTARSSHDTEGVSLVDFNRAGVPLMELVTEPVMHDAVSATNFAKELQLLLQYLDVSGANMEMGQMRVEVNISVSLDDTFGTKVEVKNINSFRAVGKTIEYEYNRQLKLIESGQKVVQETRGWDENREVTFSQRLKESAHDYRYFPEPDLPKLFISEIPEFSVEAIKQTLPELPWQKRNRFVAEFGLKPVDAETLVNDISISNFFDAVVDQIKELGKEAIVTTSNYITSDLIGLSKTVDNDFTLGLVTPINFAKLIRMIKEGKLSSRGGKDVLKVMFEVGGNPEMIANEKGLVQNSNPDELKKIIETIIKNNPSVVDEYKSGKESVLQFLVGQGMKATKGSANPEVLQKIVLDFLK
jgi:aspartyl-tRNA(Asn)/glutamyl-tRNA(Gln) amidotransferase subunit B